MRKKKTTTNFSPLNIPLNNSEANFPFAFLGSRCAQRKWCAPNRRHFHSHLARCSGCANAARSSLPPPTRPKTPLFTSRFEYLTILHIIIPFGVCSMPCDLRRIRCEQQWMRAIEHISNVLLSTNRNILCLNVRRTECVR